MSINPSQVPSAFYVRNSDYDAEIFIQVQCKDSVLRHSLMNSIYIEHKDLNIVARPPDINTTTLGRHIFVKQKSNDLKK